VEDGVEGLFLLGEREREGLGETERLLGEIDRLLEDKGLDKELELLVRLLEFERKYFEVCEFE
jgi:hypothetical protein